MNVPVLTVVEMEWVDGESGQSCVVFEGGSGRRFGAFSDGYRFRVGDRVWSYVFEGLELENSFDEVFSGNAGGERKIDTVRVWDAIVCGVVKAVEQGVMIVDAGDAVVVVDGLTRDSSCKGAPVRLVISRLEVRPVSMYPMLSSGGL